jgi:ATP-dependent RNA helicase RhlE
MTFADLNLNTPLLNALSDLGFSTPTPIQERAFSVIMSGRDVVGIAQTGTGKTFAYLLPLLRQFKFVKQKEPRILILVPTRELVVQLVSEIEKLTKYMTVRVEGIYGGTNINTQKTRISGGIDILVATPGRLIDLAYTRVLNLKHVKHFVLDEVDEMLSLGFRAQLTNILDILPKKKQNLMFSATMTEEVDALIQDFFDAPVAVEPVRAGTPLERIAQEVYLVPNFYTKLNLLDQLLNDNLVMHKVLIFGPSKRMADEIHAHLETEYPGEFEVIHSNKSQNYRLQAVIDFQSGKIRGLIATDLLARGIDVHDVSHVINVDVPKDAETYIHRIGRTGRADRDGNSILMVTPFEEEAKIAIETLMDKQIAVSPLPEGIEFSHKLLEEERPADGQVDYLPKLTAKTGGTFTKKLAKNIKVNLGDKEIYLKKRKYKKPITRGDKGVNLRRKSK